MKKSQYGQKLLQRGGVWFKRGKILLNSMSPLTKKIIEDCHSSPIGSHFGFQKTLSCIKNSFFGPICDDR